MGNLQRKVTNLFYCKILNWESGMLLACFQGDGILIIKSGIQILKLAVCLSKFLVNLRY